SPGHPGGELDPLRRAREPGDPRCASAAAVALAAPSAGRCRLSPPGWGACPCLMGRSAASLSSRMGRPPASRKKCLAEPPCGCSQLPRQRARVDDDERPGRPGEGDVELAKTGFAARDQARLDDDDVVELEALRAARGEE